jgi:VanZ family protein
MRNDCPRYPINFLEKSIKPDPIMKKIGTIPAHTHLRTYLVLGYGLFIVYASLSPFSGWQDQGLEVHAVLTMPLLMQYTSFDVIINLLVYLPLGLLSGLALQTRCGVAVAVLVATLCGATLSAMKEYAQMYLPARVSSNLDLLTNVGGTLLGALLAASIAPRAWFSLHLPLWRTRLFRNERGESFGLALVLLWVFAQINPSLPMLGSVFISEVARAPFVAAQPEPFRWMESLATLLNMLMLGTLLLILLRTGRHVINVLLPLLFVVAMTKFIMAVTLLKSWALLLWINGEAMLGICVSVMLLIAVNQLPRVQLMRLAILSALGYWILAYWVLSAGNPSVAMHLYQWNYGHLLNYNGLSQAVAWAFPLLTVGYLWHTNNLWHQNKK